MVRRLPISDLSVSSQEVAFALADERNQVVDLFLAMAEDFALTTPAPL